MSAKIDAKLEANQEKNTKDFEHLVEKMNRLVSALTTLQHGHQVHDNALVSLQDYTRKDNGKRQKHGADDNDLDSNMDDPDALHDRDALASDEQDGQGGF
eukprot:11880581-Ditylum_brightwellii.AAC.1